MVLGNLAMAKTLKKPQHPTPYFFQLLKTAFIYLHRSNEGLYNLFEFPA